MKVYEVIMRAGGCETTNFVVAEDVVEVVRQVLDEAGDVGLEMTALSIKYLLTAEDIRNDDR